MNNRLISLILTIVLLSSSVAGTFASAEGVVASETTLKINQGKDTGALQVEATGETFLSGSMESEEWEQYVGDIETFVYGLIINQLEYFFDVFPGYVELSNGNHVYGIAYTDYSDCYTNEEESLRCFEAGFIPFVGEPVVYQEEIETGLLITGIDFEDEATSFLWSYDTDSFTLHCVVYNQYLQYGIDENKAIFYETSEYVPGICDEAL